MTYKEVTKKLRKKLITRPMEFAGFACAFSAAASGLAQCEFSTTFKARQKLAPFFKSIK